MVAEKWLSILRWLIKKQLTGYAVMTVFSKQYAVPEFPVIVEDAGKSAFTFYANCNRDFLRNCKLHPASFFLRD